jgi:hypothetical protein
LGRILGTHNLGTVRFEREFRPQIDSAISVSKMGCSLKAQIYGISQSVHLIGVYLTGVYLTGCASPGRTSPRRASPERASPERASHVHLMGVHLPFQP